MALNIISDTREDIAPPLTILPRVPNLTPEMILTATFLSGQDLYSLITQDQFSKGVATHVIPVSVNGRTAEGSMQTQDGLDANGVFGGNVENFSKLAGYQRLSQSEEVWIQSLPLYIFELLRKSGLVLYNTSTCEYYVLSNFMGLSLLGLIKEMLSVDASPQLSLITRRSQVSDQNTVYTDLIKVMVSRQFFKIENLGNLLHFVNGLWQSINNKMQDLKQRSERIFSQEEMNEFIIEAMRDESIDLQETASAVLRHCPNQEQRMNTYLLILKRNYDYPKYRLLRIMELNDDLIWHSGDLNDVKTLTRITKKDSFPDIVTSCIVNLCEQYPEWKYLLETLSQFIFIRITESIVVDRELKMEFGQWGLYGMLSKGVRTTLDARNTRRNTTES